LPFEEQMVERRNVKSFAEALEFPEMWDEIKQMLNSQKTSEN
jgi:hypothetical protein